MLRVHFTGEDLVRIRLSFVPMPQMSEAVLSLQLLRRRDMAPRFGSWRLNLRGAVPAAVRPLWDIVPATGWIPDFLTPASNGDMTGALEIIRATPRKKIAADLSRLATLHPLPTWVDALAHGDPEAIEAVTCGLDTYRKVAILPYAAPIQRALDAELASKTATMAR
ncbi:hypothetical protein [Streptomyces melanogenes]|uniref:hypothetical protein n=1 Tax=Streptomyces melanogenes TaxID=67326 RepID=UPI00379D0EB8